MASNNNEDRKTARAKAKADKEIIKKADASYKASMKAKENSNGAVTEYVSPVENAQQVGTTVIDVTAEQEAQQKADNPASYLQSLVSSGKEAQPTISGKDPKTETSTQIVNKATTFEEAKEAENKGNEVANIVGSIEKETDASNAEIDAGIGTRNTEAGYVEFGDGSQISELANNGTGSYVPSQEDLNRMGAEHKALNAAQKAAAPVAAIEALGIEHYFPPQQDFMTTNFTGRYIGSRQLVTATGALYPESLTDARRRAMQKKAQVDLEARKKYWELASTTPQYDENYKDIGMDLLDKYYELSGGDIEGLMNGTTELARQYQRDMYDYESRGKNLVEINNSVNALVEKMNTGDDYIPPEIIKNMYEFRTGTADLNAYMSGSAIGDDKVRKIANTLRSYQNFTPIANKQLEILKSMGADSLPLNKDADWSDPTFATRLQDAISSTKNKGVGYDEYVKVMGEFYDIDNVRSIVEQMYDANNLWEGTTDAEYKEQINNGVKYFMSVLPDKIDIDQKLQANQNLGWAELAERKRHNQAEEKVWENTNIYQDIDKGMNNMSPFVPNALAGAKTYGDKVNALNQFYVSQNKKPVTLGNITGMAIPTQGAYLGSAKTSGLLVIGNDGKTRTAQAEIARLEKISEKWNLNQTQLESLAELREVVKQGHVDLNVQSRTAGYAVDDGSGNITPIELSSITPTESNTKNMVYFSGNVWLPSNELDEDGKIKVRKTKNTYIDAQNVSDPVTQRALANKEDSEEKRNSQYRGTSVTNSTSSGGGGGTTVSGGHAN